MLCHVAICDDNEEDIKSVYSYLRAYEKLHSEELSFEVDQYTNPVKLLPLLDTGLFLLPHSSYVVNARHVAALTAKNLVLYNGSRVPVARGRMSQIKSMYMDFLMGESNHV